MAREGEEIMGFDSLMSVKNLFVSSPYENRSDETVLLDSLREHLYFLWVWKLEISLKVF